MQQYDTYDEVLETVERSGRPYRVLGHAPGGNPLVAVETGGEREPAVFVTAGAHATEHAGVCAAVELIEELETDHRTYVVPTRDPVGLNGYEYALELGLGEGVEATSYGQVETLLREEGELLVEEGEFLLSLVGDHAYASHPPSDEGIPVLMRLKEFTETHPEVLERLAGRRVYATPSLEGVDGSEGLDRAYTIVVDTDGMPLHLNRFFTTDWAPPESRSVRRLMDDVRPGLTFDNHETTGHEDRYHISLRPQRTDELDRREREVALEITSTVSEAGATLATDEDVLSEPTRTVAHDADPPDEPFYSRAGDGAYWVDPNLTSPPRLGEGLNATDYAAEKYGLAYTLETGMYGSLEHRTRAAVRSVQTGVRAFERLHE
jgi:hypothetical protein